MDIPNSITLTAIQSDGSPATNARVRIVAESKWIKNTKTGVSVVIDSMLTDKQGRFTIQAPDTDLVRIEIISNGEGISYTFDSTRTIVSLGALSSIRAKWTPGAIVMIAGTSFSQKVDENGDVLFNHIPRFNTVLVGQENGKSPVLFSSIAQITQDTLDLGTLNIARDSLLIDQFEQNSSATLLEPFVHGSYWFSIADEHEGGNSTIDPSTAEQDDWLPAISDNSLTIHYSITPSSLEGAYAIVGCTLGNGINGNAIDSIVFMAYSDAPFTLTDGSHALIHGISTTEWSRFAVHRSELDTLGNLSKMGILQFTFNDTNGRIFRLDDFVIYGDPLELLRIE